MNLLRFIIAALLAVVFNVAAFGQMNNQEPKTSLKTEYFKVSGSCGMCKTKIEKAAKADGVTEAEWDPGTKILTLVYNPEVAKSDVILQKIAEAGYDSGKFKASEESYNKLPGCCKYQRED